MNYDKVIQDCLDALNDTDELYIPIYKVVPKEKQSKPITIFDAGNIKHLKTRQMLYMCRLFEKHSENYIKLTELGWKVNTDYNGIYSNYKKSLKPISKNLQKASVWSSIILVILIFSQLLLGFFSFLSEDSIEILESEIIDMRENMMRIESIIIEQETDYSDTMLSDSVSY